MNGSSSIKYTAFIGCAQDTEKTDVILEKMKADGFRVKEILNESLSVEEYNAEKETIKNCNACIAVITENSVNSHSFRGGLTCAVFAGKPIFTVFLESVTLSVALEMQISTTKQFHYYKMSEDSFYSDLYSEKPITECRDKTPPKEIRMWLEKVGGGEKFVLKKGATRIGKLPSMSDFAIPENKYISRQHANIININDRCFIIDKNSKNHTYINGKEIKPENEVELHDGDIVAFANEEFAFFRK